LNRVQLTVSGEDGGRTIAAILKERLAFSRSLLRRIKRQGEVLLNGRPALLVERVKIGDTLSVDTGLNDPSRIDPGPRLPDVIYEDQYLLAVNKPAGMLVHPAGGERGGTLANAVMAHWLKAGKGNPVFRPVYRLDRDTSGIVLVSSSHPAHLGLYSQIRDKTMKRIYIAVVSGLVSGEEGVIDRPIARKPGSIIEREVSPGGSPAVTCYRVIKRLPEINATVLDLSLETGRTHQIRVHMGSLGHPLLGDSLYGGSLRHIKRQALHSYRASFLHPSTGERLNLQCYLPEDMKKLVGDYTFGGEQWV